MASQTVPLSSAAPSRGSSIARAGAGGESMRWIKGPWTDLIVGCGAWTLPLAALVLYLSQDHLVVVSIAFYALSVFCNNPHYMATIYRAYGTREDFRKYRFFTVYVTVFIVLTAVLVHLTPSLLPWLFTLYITWSPWHYTGQNYGIAMLFIRRNGGSPDRLARNLFYGSFVASYLVWFLSMHSAAHAHPFTVSLGIPSGLADGLSVVFALTFLVCGGWSICRLSSGMHWRRLFPAIVLLSTQFLWFIASAMLRLVQNEGIPPVYYAVGILAFMHCAQYLWITGYYTRRETEAGSRGSDRKWRPLRYYGILILGGLALFLPGPWLVSTVLKQDFTVSYLIFVSLINLHHFILDGAIWKLRDGRISRLLLGTQGGGAGKDHHHHDHANTPDWLGAAGRWLLGRSLWGRALRATFVCGLLALGAVDQLQYFWTQSRPTLDRLARAMFLNPADTRIYVQRAGLFEKNGELEAAIAQLEEASRLSPEHPEIHKQLARLFTRAGRFDDAEDIWRKFESQFARDYETLLLRGSVLEKLRAPERALEMYHQAHRADPERLEAPLRLMDLYLEHRRPQEARKQAQRLLRHMTRREPWKGLDAEEAQAQQRIASRVAMQLGDLQRQSGEFMLALESYAISAEYARQNGHRAAESAAASRAALACADQARIADMFGWTARAVQAGEKTTDPYLCGVAWYNLAKVLDSLAGQPEQYLDAAAAAAAAQNSLGANQPAGRRAAAILERNLQRSAATGQVIPRKELPARARDMVGL